MKILLIAAASLLSAAEPAVMTSQYAPADFTLSADPGARQWKNAPSVVLDKDRNGEPVPGHKGEVRARWTDKNLYFLFVCPYEKLNLKPNPTQTEETNQLWNYDVAEVFIGTDFERIKRYKEFEMSPQGEWVDLDIDRYTQKPEGGWKWNSGWAVKARLDENRKIWYGEMRIPISSVDERPAQNGREMRINLYRCQGSGPDRKYLAWQPVHSPSFHTPEAFGLLRLTGKK